MRPFAQGGLDEALGLAVGPRRVPFGADVLEAEIAEGVAKGEGLVARAVVVTADRFDGIKVLHPAQPGGAEPRD